MPEQSTSPRIPGTVAVLMLLVSAAATLAVAVAAGAMAASATGDDGLFLLTAACGSVLGLAWLSVSMTVAASREMPMPIQLGLLVTCPVVPILAAAAAVAGYGGAVVIIAVVVGAGLLVALRKV